MLLWSRFTRGSGHRCQDLALVGELAHDLARWVCWGSDAC